MASNADDIYRELVQESEEESWLYGLVAFALMEERRIEWMQHMETTTNVVRNADQIREWYEQQPPGALLRIKGDAEAALRFYSDAVVQQAVEDVEEEVRESTIMSEIRRGQRFWRQLGLNIAGGLTSAVLFAVLLGILAWFILAGEPSLGELFGRIGRNGNG